MSKKKIDNLFLAKLKDFGEVPDEKVWKAIVTSLDQKKKTRRVIPIWWRLGGVAALLAIVFYLTDPLSDTEGDTIITDTPQVEENDGTLRDSFEVPETADEKVATSPENTESGTKEDQQTPSLNTSPQDTGENAQLAGTDKGTNEKETQVANVKGSARNKTTQIAATDTQKDISKNQVPVDRDKNVVAMTEGRTKNDPDSVGENTPVEEKGKDGLPVESNLKNPSRTEGIAEAQGQKEENTAEEANKKSIFEAIAEQEEETLVTENKGGKWSVGPNVAPVFFDSFGEGSPIHSSFASNSKSGNLNLSYGLSVSYELSKKLSVRTGVHRVDYGYDTDEILFSSSIDGSTNDIIDNINYAQASRNLVVQSKADGNLDFASANLEFAADVPSVDGRMVQEFGYLEVPLELNYALVDKKVGVNIVGGVSSLFLVDNSITLVGNGLSTEVGEANNLNSVNFSTNIGFGINYKFNPKVQLNVEPVFKYQLNTFSETAGSFRPFSIGVYSGLNFKF